MIQIKSKEVSRKVTLKSLLLSQEKIKYSKNRKNCIILAKLKGQLYKNVEEPISKS